MKEIMCNETISVTRVHIFEYDSVSERDGHIVQIEEDCEWKLTRKTNRNGKIEAVFVEDVPYTQDEQLQEKLLKQFRSQYTGKIYSF